MKKILYKIGRVEYYEINTFGQRDRNMKRENHWMMRLFILLFSISMSIAIVPCGVVNVYGAVGEVYSSVTIEAEKEAQIVKEEFSKDRKEKVINVYNVWFILCVIVSYKFVKKRQ